MSRYEDHLGGALTHYGPALETDRGFGGTLGYNGREVHAHYNVLFDDLPTTSETNQFVVTIPANAIILRASLNVRETFVGGGTDTVDVGLSQPDGTVIDANGLFAGLPEAGLVTDASVVGAGVTIGGPVSVASQVTVTLSGPFTAGAADLVVVYEKA